MQRELESKNLLFQRLTKLWFVLLAFNIFLNLGVHFDWFENSDDIRIAQEVCGDFEIQRPRDDSNDVSRFFAGFGLSTSQVEFENIGLQPSLYKEFQSSELEIFALSTTLIGLPLELGPILRRGPPYYC